MSPGYTSLFSETVCTQTKFAQMGKHQQALKKFIGCNLLPLTQHKHYPLCLPLCLLNRIVTWGYKTV